MKLKTRVAVAWTELALAAAMLTGGVAVDLTRPRGTVSAWGVGMNLVFTVVILGPLCVASWGRLQKTRTQLAELGPEAAPSVDLWTAPGAPGAIGIMVLVAALAMALIPALLYG